MNIIDHTKIFEKYPVFGENIKKYPQNSSFFEKFQGKLQKAPYIEHTMYVIGQKLVLDSFALLVLNSIYDSNFCYYWLIFSYI